MTTHLRHRCVCLLVAACVWPGGACAAAGRGVKPPPAGAQVAESRGESPSLAILPGKEPDSSPAILRSPLACLRPAGAHSAGAGLATVVRESLSALSPLQSGGLFARGCLLTI